MDPIVTDDQMISVQSQDGKVFKLTKKAAELSFLLKGAMMDFQGEITVPLYDCDAATTERLVEYLNKFNGVAPPEIEKPLRSVDMKENIDEWSANFVDNLSLEDLVNLTAAANFAEIPSLLDLTCAKIASMCKDKTEEELFKIFMVTEPFTEEEKAKIREENKWIEENI